MDVCVFCGWIVTGFCGNPKNIRRKSQLYISANGDKYVRTASAASRNGDVYLQTASAASRNGGEYLNSSRGKNHQDVIFLKI